MMRARWMVELLAVAAFACPVWAQSGTAEAVARASEQVAGLLPQLGDVKCTELVTQSRLKGNGKVEYQEQSRFDYLVTIESAGGEFTLSESRLTEQEPQRGRNLPMLVTNGFSTLFLIFHPYYRESYEFAPGDEPLADAPGFVPVRFRHIAGRRSPTVLVLRNREYPLGLTGTAWVDPQTGRIARVRAALGESLDDLGVRQLNADVAYGPVKLRGEPKPVWFPLEAAIEVETARQHWLNLHRFTDYKRFAVDTEAEVKAP